MGLMLCLAQGSGTWRRDKKEVLWSPNSDRKLYPGEEGFRVQMTRQESCQGQNGMLKER